jgi:hypothetical protein
VSSALGHEGGAGTPLACMSGRKSCQEGGVGGVSEWCWHSVITTSVSTGGLSSSEVDGKGLNCFCKGQELSLAEWFFLGSLAVQQRKHVGAQSH